jgi:hypothetical protein
MNKLFYSLILLAVGFAACKKNNYVVDQDPLTPGAVAKFNVLKTADTAGLYYIRNAGPTFNIPVGINTVSDKDRVVNLCYTSTNAVQGVQYNGPTSITIPAGKTVDTLRIQGLFAGYPTSTRVDTVYVKICGGDVPASAYWSTYRIIMRKYCDVVLATVAGAYNNTNEYTSSGAFSYGPYATTVTNLTMVAGSTTKATGTLNNLYDDGWNPITATFDWTDPAAFKVTIASQPTGKSYSGAPTNVRTSTTGTNTFNSCDRSITLAIDLVNGSTVIASAYRIVMK